ncbi:MBOAT family O-acyltransferase [Aliiglaciecola sp. 2_MG-2023]|uniref:MBOAT family O-acyltransferase n=1 Tax=unclassified Aliiglaciecola TaxID=2593648 RepID=UPI0026E1E1FF|nr:MULTISPECIES: MBOAT family O-acyltransferase [unclassified Aliiglaciecola]MDO6709210.1 MBOAT family O-acyltransferase [Aliiglaciecola sp. 2_MG-2023]MDO6750358.1 MBOAT family O-acyltransferase [Aliiglaciecola sp. 1_MG-2023]
MSFQSFHFIVFFLVTLFIVRVLLAKNSNYKKTYLLAASYYFYMCWDWRFSALILLITLINFVVGPKIKKAQSLGQKKFWLTISLASSLGILAYFKYLNFFIESANELLQGFGFTSELPILNIVLPIGISFYTFQSISYSLDIYRERVEPVSSLRDFALFVSFFPQLVAGPIVRSSYFLPQLDQHYNNTSTSIEDGFALILRGFIKKIIIADTLALHIVDPAFADPQAFSPLFLLLAIYAYSYQIYMDFSGYTDIARGVAKTLGYELQINFNRPYKAISISNFWQRWHISMSSFFRDYLYFGLGGSKSGNVYRNLFITFLMIGIWHGAGWNFVIYGFIHASFVCLERWRRESRKNRGIEEKSFEGSRLIMQIFWIFNLVAFSRLFFRGGSLEGASVYAQSMLQFDNHNAPISLVGITILSAAIIAHYLPDSWTFSWKKVYSSLPTVAQSILIVTITFLVMAFSSGDAPFVYFQF